MFAVWEVAHKETGLDAYLELVENKSTLAHKLLCTKLSLNIKKAV